MEPVSSSRVVPNFSNLPKELKLEIAGFTVQPRKHFETRAIFQVDKSTRALEKEFVQRKPNDPVSSFLRKIAQQFEDFARKEMMQNCVFGRIRKALPCLFSSTSVQKSIPDTLKNLFVGAFPKTTTVRLAALPLPHIFMQMKPVAKEVQTHLPKVRKIDLANSEINDEQLETIVEAFPQIDSIDLSNCLITDAGVQTLTKLTKLRSLKMAGCNQITGASLALIGKHLPKLTKLDLSHAVDDVPTEHFRHLYSLKNVQFLSLSHANHVGRKTLKIIGNNMPKLNHLDLQHCPGIRHEGAVHLANLSLLKTLNLSQTRIEDNTLEITKNMPRLESLSIERCFIGDEGITKLIGLKSLRYLNLSALPITNQAMQTINQNMTQLRELQIAHCANIDDEGLQALQNLSNLKRFQADGIVLGDRAVQAIHQNHPKLQKLSLASCQSITDAGVQHLASLPLYYLDLSDNTITNASTEWIAAHKHELQYLLLNYNNINDVGVKHLESLTRLEELLYQIPV